MSVLVPLPYEIPHPPPILPPPTDVARRTIQLSVNQSNILICIRDKYCEFHEFNYIGHRLRLDFTCIH
jgi:hypothetical protein